MCVTSIFKLQSTLSALLSSMMTLRQQKKKAFMCSGAEELFYVLMCSGAEEIFYVFMCSGAEEHYYVFMCSGAKEYYNFVYVFRG